MAESDHKQRLVAILAADAAGYSRLMATDDRATVTALDAGRAIFRRHIDSLQGRVIDMAGDSVLAVFESAAGAAAAALAIQKELDSSTGDVLKERRLRFRIGLHLGDIIEKPDGTVYGDGVNIAARVQALAAPGGICLTQQVYDQVHDKFEAELVDLGQPEMKNIQLPIRVFRVVLPWERTSWPIVTRLLSGMTQRGNRRRMLGALGVLVLGGLGWRLTRTDSHEPDKRAAELFVKATALSSHSSSHLEGKANNAAAIDLLEKATAIDPLFAKAHAKLGLAYVIRLFLFAPEEKDLQQKAYLAIERAFQLDPDLAEAYEARGRLRWTAFNHFPHGGAIRDFQQALKIDPRLDEAHHYLGLVYLHVGLLEDGRREFQAAIKLNPSNNGAQYRLGECYFYELKYREALNVFETIDAAFNPDLHTYQSAWSLFRIGQKGQAVTQIENSLRVFPGDRGGLLGSTLAMIHAAGGEKREAEEAISTASQKRGFGHFHHTAYNIACAYAFMNDRNAAVDWFEKAVREGLNCYPMFESDPSLATLRGFERFDAIVADERKKWETYKASFSKVGS